MLEAFVEDLDIVTAQTCYQQGLYYAGDEQLNLGIPVLSHNLATSSQQPIAVLVCTGPRYELCLVRQLHALSHNLATSSQQPIAVLVCTGPRYELCLVRQLHAPSDGGRQPPGGFLLSARSHGMVDGLSAASLQIKQKQQSWDCELGSSKQWLPTAEKGAGKALPVAKMCKSTCHLSVTVSTSSSLLFCYLAPPSKEKSR